MQNSRMLFRILSNTVTSCHMFHPKIPKDHSDDMNMNAHSISSTGTPQRITAGTKIKYEYPYSDTNSIKGISCLYITPYHMSGITVYKPYTTTSATRNFSGDHSSKDSPFSQAAMFENTESIKTRVVAIQKGQ